MMNSESNTGSRSTGAVVRARWRARKATAELREGGGGRPVVLDEASIVARKTEESADCPNDDGWRPGEHSLHLFPIHGNTVDQYDMAEVGHRSCTEEALGFLKVKLVGLQLFEHKVDMGEMLQAR
jgi:hypothetical protein